MKGTILKCLKDMIVKDHGIETWENILVESDMDILTVILISSDMDDNQAIKLFNSTSKVLDIDFKTLADRYGEYWSNGYADKMYKHHYSKHNNAKSFLLDLDSLHFLLTEMITNAKPPRFTYQLVNDNTLLMTYTSHRQLIDLFVGLTSGLGKHYNEDLKIHKLDNNQIEIIFP